jgi:plasmid maintenance system killer protein
MFRSKALTELWAKGRVAKIDAHMCKRVLIRLDPPRSASIG